MQWNLVEVRRARWSGEKELKMGGSGGECGVEVRLGVEGKVEWVVEWEV